MVSDNKQDTSKRGPDLDIFVRDVRDGGEKLQLQLRPWATIKDVKDALHQITQVAPGNQRLFYGPLLTSGGELPNHRSLQDAGISRSGETLLLDMKRGMEDHLRSSLSSFRSITPNDIYVSSSTIDLAPCALKELVHSARGAFARGLKPEFILEGSGGSYYLHDPNKNKIAVFKPADEEPYAENNPRGYLPQPRQQICMREGVTPGQACIREVAAYLLDHDSFARVPMTTLAEARHPVFNFNGSRLTVAAGGASMGAHSLVPGYSSKKPQDDLDMKTGSFQEFVRSDCTMDDLSPSKIDAKEVQRIAILDIRLMNADRNAANLLCRRTREGGLELVPIDHGYCLRSVCDTSWMDWCWLDWPQLKEPICDEFKEYIERLDVESDARILREILSIDERAIDNFRASTALLKAGVKAGLTLYDIAILCCRNDDLGEVPSALEKLSSMASELATAAIQNERWDHVAASRALADQLSPKAVATPQRASVAGFRMFKSVSSGDFLSSASTASSSGDKGVLEDVLREGEGQSPPMAQSSDSSTDTCDLCETEECEEWAATVIADVSVDQINLPVVSHRSQRAISIGSDDGSNDGSLSSSPKGFWHVRPGSIPENDTLEDSDDNSLSWSPSFSPSTSMHGTSPPSPLNLNSSSPPNIDRRTSVKFADNLPKGPFIPPVPSPSRLAFPVKPDVLSLGMTRSKSYSGFGRAMSSSSGSERSSVVEAPLTGNPKASKEGTEHFRCYYMKFIDLVIAREITAAAHSTKETSTTV